MQNFTLAMVQAHFPQKNNANENIDIMEEWVQTATRAKADLVMFGELSISGYLLDSSHLVDPGEGSVVHYRRAEEVPGPAANRLTEIAREHGVFIAAGIADIQAGVVYNSYFLVGPEGYLGKQRKTHMPAVEYPYYGVGSEFHVFDIGICRIGISICFDNWFPETSRTLALKGAEVILAPFMWKIPSDVSKAEKDLAVERRRNKHMKIFPARAMDNGVYVMVLDHVGLEADNFELPGVSTAFSPTGDVLAQSNPYVEEMVLVELKEHELERARTVAHHNKLQYRRPAIYSELVKQVP